eukprot:evm.model.scf_2011.2 EVM.evm.TU.scf_2011.2   scf_2011:5235-11310(-)
MKLDVSVLRLLSKDDFRVLTAVEMGQRNHVIVPIPLVESIAKLKWGGTHRCLRELLKHKLVHHENRNYDGYRLTYMGYDYLALRTFVQRGSITGVGRQIGVGKESDVFEATNEDGDVLILKLHRLGRTSFRAVKTKRDYLRHRNSFSWLYLSRLSALGEYAFMKALGQRGFPVPEALDQNRHAVLMSLVKGYPIVQVHRVQNPNKVYTDIIRCAVRMAEVGLVHCDFNEFNVMIDDDEEITMIDFPQMISVRHPNAKHLFDRDIECLIKFFQNKLHYDPEEDESLECVRPDFDEIVSRSSEGQGGGTGDGGDVCQGPLDVELSASGFQARDRKILSEHVAADARGSEEEAASSGEESEDNVDDEDDIPAYDKSGGGSADDAPASVDDDEARREMARRAEGVADASNQQEGRDGGKDAELGTQAFGQSGQGAPHKEVQQWARSHQRRRVKKQQRLKLGGRNTNKSKNEKRKGGGGGEFVF